MLFRRRVAWPGAAIGLLIFAGAFALFGAGLLGQWDSVRQGVADFSGGPAQVRVDAWNHAVRLVTGADYELARGLDAPIADAEVRHTLSVAIHWLLLAVLGFGIAAAIYCAARGGTGSDLPAATPAGANPYCRRDAALIALIWFLTPILLLTYTGSSLPPFFLLLSLPAGHVLAAWGLGVIFQPERRPGGPLLALLAIPFAVVLGLNSARAYQATAAHPGASGLNALPLAYGLPLGEAIRAALPPGGIVLSSAPGEILNSLAGETFAVLDEARAPRLTLIPAEGGLTVAAYPPGATPARPAATRPAARFELPDGWTLALDVFPTDAASVCQTGIDAAFLPGPVAIGYPAAWGISLTYAALDRQGDTWTLITAWEVGAAAGTRHPAAPFVDVLDAGQEGHPRVLRVAGEVVPGTDWRAGDCHVQRMAFSLPAAGVGPFTLQAGLIEADSGTEVVFTEPGTGIETPLIPLPFSLER